MEEIAKGSRSAESFRQMLVQPTKLVIALLLLQSCTKATHADTAWEKKIIRDVQIEVPAGSKADVQNPAAAEGAPKLEKYSFRTRVLDLELVFLTFPPGKAGNLNRAAANMAARIKSKSGAESLTPWQPTTVSGRPARYLATKPDREHAARQVTLIDDTRAKNQIVIVDISYDASSDTGKTDSEHITKSVEMK